MDTKLLNKVNLFRNAKKQCLNKEDLSRKGSIDEPIRQLVEILNANDNYYTTSTCSGRISLIEKPHDNPAIKKGGRFILNEHEPIETEKFLSIYKSHSELNRDSQDCLWLKFEPFILHVQCYDLHYAHQLLNTALAAGCRNSGLTLGKHDKFLVAIRSTSSMEVPIHSGQNFNLQEDYIRFLCDECNRRLRDNLQKLTKFQDQVFQLLSINEKDKKTD